MDENQGNEDLHIKSEYENTNLGETADDIDVNIPYIEIAPVPPDNAAEIEYHPGELPKHYKDSPISTLYKKLSFHSKDTDRKFINTSSSTNQIEYDNVENMTSATNVNHHVNTEAFTDVKIKSEYSLLSSEPEYADDSVRVKSDEANTDLYYPHIKSEDMDEYSDPRSESHCLPNNDIQIETETAANSTSEETKPVFIHPEFYVNSDSRTMADHVQAVNKPDCLDAVTTEEENALPTASTGKSGNMRRSTKKAASSVTESSGERLFACPDCGRQFNRRSHLNNHRRTHTGEKPFSCADCGRQFAEKSNLTKHILLHSDDKPFSCPDCDKTFADLSFFKRHQIIHSGVKPFSCADCGKRFVQRGQLNAHRIIHSGEKPFSCTVCGKRFAQRGHLKIHWPIHTGVKAFSCTECGKRFTDRSNLRRHVQIHTGKKPFSCSVCGKEYTQRHSLIKHEFLHTLVNHDASVGAHRESSNIQSVLDMNSDPMNEACSYDNSSASDASCLPNCDLQGQPRADLLDDTLPHSQFGKSMPGFVNPDFSVKPDLRSAIMEENAQIDEEQAVDRGKCLIEDIAQHKSSDDRDSPTAATSAIGKPTVVTSTSTVTNSSGEKRFSCDDCGKQFSRESRLRIHRRMHTGERPFSCPDCGRQFAEKSNLTKHQLLHLVDRPYSCTDCGKTFTALYIFKRHQRVHSAVKRFSCTDCGKRFPQQCQLNNHKRVHSGEKPFSCTVCGKIFSQRSHLKIHWPIHTGVKAFACTVCGKRFADRSNLRKHERIHSGKKPFSYTVSAKECTEQMSLTKPEHFHTSVNNNTDLSLSLNENFDQNSSHEIEIKPEYSDPDLNYIPSESGSVDSSADILLDTKNREFTVHESSDHSMQVDASEYVASSSHKESSNNQSVDINEVCSYDNSPTSDAPSSPNYELQFQPGADLLDETVPHSPFGNSMPGFVNPDCSVKPDLDSAIMEEDTQVDEEQAVDTGKPTSETSTTTITNTCGEKLFACADCGKQFHRQSHLNNHRRIHTGEKPFSCPDCGRQFAEKSNLAKHQLLHLEEKPFSCADCDKQFTALYTFKKHQRIHSGEKTFFCTDCGKSFLQRYQLNEHRRIHSSEKPFSCADCGKQFVKQSYLRKHQRIH